MVVISRDVIFGETVYPFQKLNPNAGTHLGGEILIIPTTTQHHNSGDEIIGDSMTDMLVNHVAPHLLCHVAAPKKISSPIDVGLQSREAFDAQGVEIDCSMGVDLEADMLQQSAGDPNIASATVPIQTSTVLRDRLPGRQVAAQPEADSPLTTVRNLGVRGATDRHHVDQPRSSGSTSGSSVASTGTLPSSNSSSPAHQISSFGSDSTSSPVAPIARHGTRLQHGISKPKIYTGGTVLYSLFFASSEPQHHNKALHDACWKKAMDSEFDALLKNETWHLAQPRVGTNVIDCKWVYKIK
jgi:hypothetical protein